jgi:hypothetical protein
MVFVWPATAEYLLQIVVSILLLMFGMSLKKLYDKYFNNGLNIPAWKDEQQEIINNGIRTIIDSHMEDKVRGHCEMCPINGTCPLSKSNIKEICKIRLTNRSSTMDQQSRKNDLLDEFSKLSYEQLVELKKILEEELPSLVEQKNDLKRFAISLMIGRIDQIILNGDTAKAAKD